MDRDSKAQEEEREALRKESGGMAGMADCHSWSWYLCIPLLFV